MLYKPSAKSNGKWRFSTLTTPSHLNRFSRNFKYITIFQTRPDTQNFSGGVRRRRWSAWANSQFYAWKFLSFPTHRT